MGIDGIDPSKGVLDSFRLSDAQIKDDPFTLLSYRLDDSVCISHRQRRLHPVC